MTNRSSSKQHGLSNANRQRPKSLLRKRRNKDRARELRAIRRANKSVDKSQ